MFLLKALHEEDDGGGDDMAINMDGGKMDEFFQVNTPFSLKP